MKRINFVLLAGATFGFIDIVSMLIQKLPWYETASAFSFWIVIALANYFIDVKIKDFLKGIIISLISCIPVTLMLVPQGIQLLIIILSTNIVLGALLGIVVGKIKQKQHQQEVSTSLS